MSDQGRRIGSLALGGVWAYSDDTRIYKVYLLYSYEQQRPHTGGGCVSPRFSVDISK